MCWFLGEDEKQNGAIDALQNLVTFVTPGHGLLDTGAGKAIIGRIALKALGHRLQKAGLAYVWVPRSWWSHVPKASGVGGSGTVIGIALVPITIAGRQGVVEFTVLEEDVPPLIPNALLCSLSAVIDLSSSTLRIGSSVQPLTVFPSKHVAVPMVPSRRVVFTVPRVVLDRYPQLNV